MLRRWLADLPAGTHRRIEVITMDGFIGYAPAVEETIPTARKVMNPFHVAHLAAEKLTTCRQRTQRDTTGRRGRSKDFCARDPDYVGLEVT